ncbi:hypothetical protein SAMN05444354_10132 [Stigmatella aurantiaca]|uniref:Uncharacterized protein n=1 Tax=Stigmatella aurantiaca TaxID=41 RepID=A0A1H7FDW9_STIAU|nr:hypothetical protein [Stigmatella aurantiaca]SEK22602.1 hypothetical protein SAMN05444354_10132 [Stigmatella aurantiaca]
MKTLVMRASFLVAAVMAVAVGPLGTAQAAEEAREPSTNLCLAAPAGQTASFQEPGRLPGVREAQDSGAALGYCTVDCSRCATSQECRSRGAGSCTAISACRAPSQE